MQRWHGPLFHVNPVVIAPIGFLDRGFAAQNTATILRGGATGQMHKEGLALGGLDQIAMAGPLQGRKRRVL